MSNTRSIKEKKEKKAFAIFPLMLLCFGYTTDRKMFAT